MPWHFIFKGRRARDCFCTGNEKPCYRLESHFRAPDGHSLCAHAHSLMLLPCPFAYTAHSSQEVRAPLAFIRAGASPSVADVSARPRSRRLRYGFLLRMPTRISRCHRKKSCTDTHFRYRSQCHASRRHSLKIRCA